MPLGFFASPLGVGIEVSLLRVSCKLPSFRSEREKGGLWEEPASDIRAIAKRYLGHKKLIILDAVNTVTLASVDVFSIRYPLIKIDAKPPSRDGDFGSGLTMSSHHSRRNR